MQDRNLSARRVARGPLAHARTFQPRLEVLERRNLLAAVAGRFLFYDQSSFDGNVAGVTAADDGAIAPGKTPLLPSDGLATFSSVSSYSRGINGVMVDISGAHGTITANDFIFRLGDNNAPGQWGAAPTPTTVSVRAGAGTLGSDRVEITWASGAIRNSWLQIHVLPNANTGLTTADVFLFGNKVGEVGTSPPAGVFLTSGADATAVLGSLGGSVGIGSPHDMNRDNNVTAADKTIVVGSLGSVTRLNVPATPPVLTAGLANDTGTGGDGITFDATITGTLSGVNEIVTFTAGFDASPATVDVFTSLQLNGTFTLSPAVLNTVFGGTLSNGLHTLHLRGTDAKGTIVTKDVTFTLDTVAPTISANTMMSFTVDVTPHVTVTSSDAGGLANGTQVRLDVDLNNDGDFTDAGETNRTLSTLYSGGSYFQLNPALPATDGLGQAYLTQIRVRVTDSAGNEGTSPLQSLLVDTKGSSALSDYVHAVDGSYGYDSPTTISGTGYTARVYDMTSQSWRTLADVNRTVWHHWLTVIVPTGSPTLPGATALLVIDSGSNNDARPTTVDSNLALVATSLNVVVVHLKMVPNQPLTFTGSPPETEDGIIAYTFDQFVDHLGQPGNDSWPALLPMVKSAVRAMDTVQAVDTTLPASNITNFVVTGGSKRGWTTWLTAAVDPRVTAIIPRVFDTLNLGEQFEHHHAFYDGLPSSAYLVDGFSTAIEDYVNFQIPQNLEMDANRELARIIDPYFYLNNGHFNIPKLLLNASQDEFFVPDSSQFYFSDLPGTQNYLRYLPNNGHGLNATQVTSSTLTFMNAVINNLTLPQFSWTVQADGSLSVQTTTAPTQVLLWSATNPTARDFRKAVNPSLTYTSTVLTNQGNGLYVGSAATPATGATAFFVELTFASPLAGRSYVFTTEIRVVSQTPLGDWPFYRASNAGFLASSDNDARNAAVDALTAGIACSSGAPMLLRAEPTVQPASLAPSRPMADRHDASNKQTWLATWEYADNWSPKVDDAVEELLAGLEAALNT